MLQTPNLIIRPWTAEAAVKLNDWMYDDHYKNFFRHQPRLFTYDQLLNYPKEVGAQVLVIYAKDRIEGQYPIIGIAQITPCSDKTNQGFNIGLIIDKYYQGNRYPLESFIAVFDYCFNKLGFRKAVVEVVKTHESLLRIVKENGFLKEGEFIGECFIDGKFVNEYRYCMTDVFYNKKFKPIKDKWNV